MRRRIIATLALPFLLTLVACDARRSYPPGFTDTELWQGEPIRPDTEVPNQYPDGTTRDTDLEDEGTADH